MSKVAVITVYDEGSGIAEILERTDKKIKLQWINFVACYSFQVYSKRMYSEPTEYNLKDVYDIDKENEIDELEIKRQRILSIVRDREIFSRYKEMKKKQRLNIA